MKRIVTVQDISCVGRCSLTAALPIISAMGVECAVLPTAVLSNHTAFNGFTFRDLTDELQPIMQEWDRQGFRFDAVYTGYLGSEKQISLISAWIDALREKNPAAHVIVDPAMADFGHLYTGFDCHFASAMTDLCRKADIILPNLTEASYMLGIPYKEHFSEAEVRCILQSLSSCGCTVPILTGVSLHEGKIGAMAYDSRVNRYFSYENELLPGHYHGTGDLFASVITGALTRGMTIDGAVSLAVDFVVSCIRATAKDPDARWYGVNFESEIGMLTKALQSFQ